MRIHKAFTYTNNGQCQIYIFIYTRQIYLITETSGIATGAIISYYFVAMKLNNLAFYFRLFCRGESEMYTIYASVLRLILLWVPFSIVNNVHLISQESFSANLFP